MSYQGAVVAVLIPFAALVAGSYAAASDQPGRPLALSDGLPSTATPMPKGQALDAQTPDERPLYLQVGLVPPGAVVGGLEAVEPTQQESQPRPLMSLLNQAGVGGGLTQNRIDVYGWIQGSFTHNFNNHRDPKLNSGRLFDVQDNVALINQLDLTIERLVDLKSHHFDVGGRVDFLYGGDARFIHSSGMFDGDTFPSPQYQFDIPQIYVDLGLPVGNGLRLRLGKFEFFKPIDPNLSPFYSHTFSYVFVGGGNVPGRVPSTFNGGGLPYTLTGVTAYYEFDDRFNVEGGISRGFDQSLEDNNSAIDGFGRINYAVSDRTKLSFAFIVGPEIDDDNSHYRAVGDVSLTHSLSDKFALLVDLEYGYQARPESLFLPITSGGVAKVGVGDAHWYGVSAAGIYQINRHVSAALRGEWYRDEDGYTTGSLNPATGLPEGQNLYEVTAGLTITPFPDSAAGSGFKVRPEVRYDYCDKPFFRTDSASPTHGQFTIAIDAIYNF